MVSVEQLAISMPMAGEDRTILRETSFAASAGEIVAVVGGSGAGKTSLLVALGGGADWWLPGARISGGMTVFGAKPTTDDLERRHSLVTQNASSQFSGFKSTAAGELAVPLEMRGTEPRLIAAEVERLAERLGLERHLQSPLEHLSGGQVARLNIGAALISRPRLLLLDQAHSELDPAFRVELIGQLKAYCRDQNAVCIMTALPGELDGALFDRQVYLGSQSGEEFSSAASSRTSASASGTEAVLRVRDLWFRYTGNHPFLLRGLSFQVSRGEGMFLLGRNGAGKSTIGKLLSRWMLPTRGEIVYPQEKENAFAKKNGRPMAGFGFQNPDYMFCRPTVREEIAIGSYHGPEGEFDELLKILGLKQYLAENPFALPRHVRKRLSVALAARSRPPLVFLDEPSQLQDGAALSRVAEAMEFLRGIGLGVICVTHDPRLIALLNSYEAIDLDAQAKVD